jgi:hypothetical protein
MKKRLISYYMNEKFFVELVSTVGEIKVMIFTADALLLILLILAIFAYHMN